MASPRSSLDEDLDQVRKAQQGDPEALATLRQNCHDSLVNILLARGASRSEAEEILADVWSDCVPGADHLPTLLTKYPGKFSLLSWLAKVAGNRWIDLKRRAARMTSVEDMDLEDLAGCTTPLQDDALVEMLRESIRNAFAHCADEAMVLLRLVYLHGVTQREVGRMLGWSETKTSRTLAEAMDQIKTQTLQQLRQRDSRLELAWEDFVGLCDTSRSEFL